MFLNINLNIIGNTNIVTSKATLLEKKYATNLFNVKKTMNNAENNKTFFII